MTPDFQVPIQRTSAEVLYTRIDTIIDLIGRMHMLATKVSDKINPIQLW